MKAAENLPKCKKTDYKLARTAIDLNLVVGTCRNRYGSGKNEKATTLKEE